MNVTNPHRAYCAPYSGEVTWNWCGIILAVLKGVEKANGGTFLPYVGDVLTLWAL